MTRRIATGGSAKIASPLHPANSPWNRKAKARLDGAWFHSSGECRGQAHSTIPFARSHRTTERHHRQSFALSAAAAFQMGVLLGQVMNNTGALSGLKKTMAAAPGAIAAHIPTFGLFDDKPVRKRRAAVARARPALAPRRRRPVWRPVAKPPSAPARLNLREVPFCLAFT